VSRAGVLRDAPCCYGLSAQRGARAPGRARTRLVWFPGEQGAPCKRTVSGRRCHAVSCVAEKYPIGGFHLISTQQAPPKSSLNRAALRGGATSSLALSGGPPATVQPLTQLPHPAATASSLGGGAERLWARACRVPAMNSQDLAAGRPDAELVDQKATVHRFPRPDPACLPTGRL